MSEWTPEHETEFAALMRDFAASETALALAAHMSDLAAIVNRQFAGDPATRDALLAKTQAPVRHGGGLASLAEDFSG